MDHSSSPGNPVSIHPDVLALKDKAQKEGLETVWERFTAQQPQCGFCELGLSCRICVMGPCRIDPFGDGPQRGVCGADADIMVARNLARMIAAGAASHSDHGRDLVETLLAVGEGKAPGFGITDQAKLDRLAAEFGVAADLPPLAKAKELALAMMEEYGIKKGYLTFTRRLPAARLEKWRNLGPRAPGGGLGSHRNDAPHSHGGGQRRGQPPGPGPEVRPGGRLGRLHDRHGDLGRPVRDAQTHGLPGQSGRVEGGSGEPHPPRPLPPGLGNGGPGRPGPETGGPGPGIGGNGHQLVGLCCTGNEVLMRRGIPMAGNHLVQELALITGAVEAMVVDYQCIMPSLGDLAACYHTKFYTTAPKAKFPGATHLPFSPENGEALGRELVAQAVENFARRRPERVLIPGAPVSQVSGFSVEVIEEALGGTWEPLLDAIKAGQIRGAVGVVGCNNPKVVHDYGHTTLTRKLIEHDILVVDTGCAAVAHAKAGFKRLEAAELAGPGLKANLPGVRDSAGPAHGVLRGQHPHRQPGRGAGQRPGGGPGPIAPGRGRARVVFREGRHHRLLCRGQRDLHGAGGHAPGPGEQCGHRPFAQRTGGARGGHLRGGDQIPPRLRTSSSTTWRASAGRWASRPGKLWGCARRIAVHSISAWRKTNVKRG